MIKVEEQGMAPAAAARTSAPSFRAMGVEQTAAAKGIHTVIPGRRGFRDRRLLMGLGSPHASQRIHDIKAIQAAIAVRRKPGGTDYGTSMPYLTRYCKKFISLWTKKCNMPLLLSNNGIKQKKGRAGGPFFPVRPLFSRSPQTVGDHQQACAHVREYRHPHGGVSHEGQSEKCRFHAKRQGYVLHEDGVGGP